MKENKSLNVSIAAIWVGIAIGLAVLGTLFVVNLQDINHRGAVINTVLKQNCTDIEKIKSAIVTMIQIRDRNLDTLSYFRTHPQERIAAIAADKEIINQQFAPRDCNKISIYPRADQTTRP